MEKNDPYLERIKETIEESLGWGNSKDWNNADFEELSERIWTKAGTRLSISTLKRIWGKVRYESSPTAATLNALALYVGLGDWRTFKQSVTVAPMPEPDESDGYRTGKALASPVQDFEANSEKKPPQAGETGQRGQFVPPVRTGLLTGAAIAAALAMYGVVALFAGGKPGVEKKPLSPDIIFTNQATTSDLPNSVVFNYDLKGYRADSAFIQQSWDPTRRERVPADGKQYTSIYYLPGFFTAKLIVNDQIVRESAVFIKTNGWKGIVDRKPIPVYLSDEEIKSPGYLGISGSVLEKKTGSPVFNDTWVVFTNVRSFEGLKGDDFSLDMALRNTSPVEASICRKVRVKILGTTTAIIIPLSTKGCIADLALLTGGRWIDGKHTDLSAFGCDFSQWQSLHCQVHAGRLLIKLGDKVALNTPEPMSVGDIIGLRIEFEGTGQLKDVTLKAGVKTVYQSAF